MKAEIITIGDEILIGQTIDSNSAYMGKELNKIGVAINRITSVSDSREEIITALIEAQSRVDFVLITGGLGPTRDDITKIALTEFFNTELIEYPEIKDFIVNFFSKRNRPILDVNIQQAYLPKDCTIIRNMAGTASGMWFERNGKVVVSMPGVPYEMKYIMENGVLAGVSNFFKTPSIIHKTIMTFGIGESFLAEKIKDWENSLDQENIHIAYLPSLANVKIRLSIQSDNGADSQEKIDRKVMELLQIVPEYIYGYDDELLEAAVGNILRERKKTVTAAESCTGGYVSHLLTSISGSSDYFLGAVIAYTNTIKMKELNVKEESLKLQGAVSQEVIEQMAQGVRLNLNSDYGIATSGIAGPNGGTDKKPVGMVWIAVADKNGVKSKCLQLSNHRERNIQMASYAVLNLLRLHIIS